MGEDSGREDGDAASALGPPLGEDNMGEPQVRTGFEVKTRSLRVNYAKTVFCDWSHQMLMTRLLYRWEMATMSITRSFLNLLSYFRLLSVDADMYEYLK